MVLQMSLCHPTLCPYASVQVNGTASVNIDRWNGCNEFVTCVSEWWETWPGFISRSSWENGAEKQEWEGKPLLDFFDHCTAVSLFPNILKVQKWRSDFNSNVLDRGCWFEIGQRPKGSWPVFSVDSEVYCVPQVQWKANCLVTIDIN